jgi:hypothetical protein
MLQIKSISICIMTGFVFIIEYTGAGTIEEAVTIKLN